MKKEKQNTFKSKNLNENSKKEEEMDEDLKDVIKYVLGTFVGYTAFWTLLTRIVSDLNLIIIYTLILTAFLWLAYLQAKISKIKGGEKDDKK